SYEGQTGFEFLKTVPVTWDETRFLAGEAGEFVVIARRQDKTWYLGGITNQTKRDLNIPLNMLETGEYEAEIFSDGSMNEEEPNAINLSRQAVTAGTSLKVAMASGGGFVASIRPR
ncbi:MAG: glycoside hydrolase family 97 C-terminal domain-containing protein, partial [bacterium]